MKTKVLIVVEGGVITEVNSNSDIEIVIVDKDSIKENGNEQGELDFNLSVYSPDAIQENLYEIFKDCKDEISILCNRQLEMINF